MKLHEFLEFVTGLHKDDEESGDRELGGKDHVDLAHKVHLISMIV